MDLKRRNQPLMLILVTALLALLPLLAVLQYKWLGEVSNGERERMKTNLRAGTSKFSQDFDREMSNIYISFQADATQFGVPSDKDLSDRYRRWQANSSHPRLIKEIYQAQIDANDIHQLMRFDPHTNRFEATQWPETLSDFRQRLEHYRKASESAQKIIQNVQAKNFGGALIQLSIGPIDENIPALLIPLLPTTRPDNPGRLDLQNDRPYRIVVLDLDYIKQEFIPELFNRYFSNGGKSDYHVTVVGRENPQKVIYRSDPGLPASVPAKSDISESFFKIRVNEFDKMLIAGTIGDQDRAGEGKTDGKRVAIRVLQSDINLSHAYGNQKLGDLPRSIIKMSNEGFWQIAVQHRAGSLEAAVTGARRRNLAISFGILLLLGISVGLIVLSSRRAQKLANQQIEFVAGVSHELRTPLAVICSAADNLADGVIDNKEQIKRYGGLIRNEGRRLTGMVEQVLEFAGAQSGRKTYELRPAEMARVIEDALASCRLQIAEGGFEIEKSIDENLPVVKADAAALSRAIQNLLNNAVKYCGENRWIGVSATTVKTTQGKEFQIKISDKGLGIGPSELPHIFEPFYRGKEVSAAQIHGNGLGLSLVKHIIEAHGGRVGVESKSGQGTTFTLHLPVVRTERPESAEEKYDQAHFAR